MNRIAKQLVLTLSAIAMVGCGGGTYKPNATDTNLASYAGQARYPRQINPVKSPDLFCSIAPNATLTLWNSSDQPLSAFELWINEGYTLHVDKVDARDSLSIDPSTIYNNKGENLKGVPASSINTVQVQIREELLTVRGPIIQH